ncbi:MAG: sulfur carrier protein ThiS [Eubacteriaceae bacterium]|nr:sulfur carrier protein ThiS [Eubacteriaceae bacterium]MDD4508743.1 sulfur carrier protein ThiS [Eubacteriaceae bacterium]
MITVNGREIAGAEGKMLSDVMEAQGFDRKRIAVERNGLVIPRNKHALTQLADGDHLEVVTFVGGG